MLTLLLIFANLCFSPLVGADGLPYSQEALKKYGSSRSWGYITQFVTPPLFAKLDEMEGKEVLDAGCGVGLWSFYAAKRGANVTGIDFQKEMVEQANALAHIEGVSANTSFAVGDVTELKLKEDTFDFAMSVNVACNLSKEGVDKHFAELKRVVKEGGEVVFVVPTSLDALFTTGDKEENEIQKEIEEVLKTMKTEPTLQEIQEGVNTLTDVLSATFVIREGRLTLLTPKMELKEGELIYRKLPTLTIPNRYYTEETYLKSIKNNNFKVKEVLQPHFPSKEAREAVNATLKKECQLGAMYEEKHPFVLFCLES